MVLAAKVLAPAKLCVPVVTTPGAVADAGWICLPWICDIVVLEAAQSVVRYLRRFFGSAQVTRQSRPP